MTAPTKVLLSPPSGMLYHDPGIVRPRSDITWSGEVGNVDIRFQWDTDSGFGGSQNEIVSLEYENATSGTYVLDFDGVLSNTINWDDSTSQIQTAIEAAANVHTVTVTGSGTVADPYLVEFTDPINGERNIPDMAVDTDSLVGDTLTLAIDTQGSAGPPIDILVLNDSTNAYEQAPDSDLGVSGEPWYWRVAVVDRDDGAGSWSSAQTLNYADPIVYRRYLYQLANVGIGFDYVEGSPNLGDSPNYRFLVWNDGTGGTFTLTHDSNVTATIGYDGAASLVESELEGLASIVAVRVRKVTLGTGVRGWDVEFQDPGHSDETVTVQDSGITGDTIGGLDPLQPGDAWGTGGTVGPDGDPIDERRYLHLLGNVGVGFHTTDEPAAGWGTGIGGTEGPDGDIRDDFDRYLYLLANADTTQPCPFIYSLSASVANAGDGLTVFGQGFGDNSSPDYGAEVRLYETPSFASPFVLLTEVLVTDGDTQDTYAVTVPGSVVASGYVAVVHTVTPTCSGSNFIFLTVLPASLDPDAGWWIEAWTEDGTQKIIDSIDVISASFQPILNGVGGGMIEVAADYSRISEIIIPDPRDSNGDPLPPYASLLRVFLHGVEQYAFYAEELDVVLKDQADTTVRISGDGIESSLKWGIVYPANHPSSQDTPLLDHLYGSATNLLANGNLESGQSRLSNLGFETGDIDPWTPEPLGGTIAADNVVFRNGAWGAKITPTILDGGAGVDLTVSPGDRIFFDSYVSESGATGSEVTLVGYYIDGDDNEVELDSDPVNLAATWKLGALEFTVPGEITNVRIAWRFTDSVDSPVDFFIDDNFEAGSINPWFAKGGATIALSDEESGDGRFSLKITPVAFGDGARYTFTVNPGQKVTETVAVSGPVGDGVTFRTIIGGTPVTDSVVLTGVPAFDVLTINGTPGAQEQTLLFEVYTTETSGFAPFYVDVGSALAGEDAGSGGGIFLDFFAAVQARGILSTFQTDFSTTADSKGEAYDEPSLSTQIRRSSTLLDIAGQMAGFGLDWKVTSQKVIQFFNNLGSDLTVMSNAPVLRNGLGVDGGKVTRQVPKITRVFAEGSDGIWTTKTNPADEIGIEPKEKYLAATSSLDATALDRAATADLETGNARQSAIRIDLIPESGVLPFFDFIVGDTIFVDLYDEDGDPLVTIEQYPDGFRVIGISAELSGEEPHYTVDLNWMVLEEQAARDAALKTLQSRQQLGSVSPGGVTGEDTIGGGALIFPSTQDHKHKSVDITDLDALQGGDPAGGDLAGVYPNPVVNGLRGIPFATGSPNDGDAPVYDSATAKLGWGAAGGGGGGSSTPAFWFEETNPDAWTTTGTLDLFETAEYDMPAGDYKLISRIYVDAADPGTWRVQQNLAGAGWTNIDAIYTDDLRGPEGDSFSMPRYIIQPITHAGGLVKFRVRIASEGGTISGGVNADERFSTRIAAYQILGFNAEPAAYVNPIDVPPAAPNADNQEDFADLDDWTFVEGAAGTVDLDSVVSAEVADIATRSGTLLIQTGPATADEVEMRMDRTLADGECVIVKLTLGSEFAASGDNSNLRLTLNTSDVSESTLPAIGFGFEQDGGTIDLQTLHDFPGLTHDIGDGMYGIPIYLRVDRNGLVYKGYYSWTGHTWNAADVETAAGEYTNIWLYSSGGASGNSPIHAVDWIRFGVAGSFDPWPLVTPAIESSHLHDLGRSSLLAVPPAVNVEDDHFNDPTLDAKWISYNSETVDLTELPGWCKIATGTALLQAVPGGDWTIEGEFLLPQIDAAIYSSTGLILTDGTAQGSSDDVRFFFGMNNILENYRYAVENFSNGSFSSTDEDWVALSPRQHGFLRIVKVGTTYSFYQSVMGHTFQEFFEDASLSITPTHFGFWGVGSLCNYFIRT